MSTTRMPSTVWRPTAASQEPLEPPRRTQGYWQLLRHPLTVICAVQAALSLILVWSNTAFGDEAEYLWVGRLEIAHWLGESTWPSQYADHVLSGSPVIYPPIGALADSVGGIAGARILSLGFMLGATALLYLMASRLLGRTPAVAATALWALTEPAIRLAFATFDPLSVLLTALSAWLVVQAGYRKRHLAFVAAAGASLALANATAYSGLVIDPIMIAFAFLVWLPDVGKRQATLRMACFIGSSALLFGLLMTASRSWSGLRYTVLYRSLSDHQSSLLVLRDIWGYSGLIISVALIGVITAVGVEGRQRAALLALLGCAALIVPAAQLRDQTGWSLDKHLAYGIWFAAMPAGYACSKLIWWLPGASRRLAAVCCVIALVYPAGKSFESAWQVYHSWANARSFIAAFRPVVTRSQGFIYTAGQDRVAEYYTLQGTEWTRWTAALSLDPVAVAPDNRESYYTDQLGRSNYGVITLFYSTTFSSAPELPGKLLLSPPSSSTNRELLGLVGDGSGEHGLPALTLALESDPEYHLVAVGPYSSAHDHAIYAIWQKVQS